MNKPRPPYTQADKDQATADYIRDEQRVRDRTEALRAQRLARDAENKNAPPPPKPAAKKKSPNVKSANAKSPKAPGI